MQVKSVENTNSNIGFRSKKRIEEATAFVNMDDSQLQFLAYTGTLDKNKEKKRRNSLTRTFYALPVVDTIASGILAKRVYENKAGIKRVGKTLLSTRVKAAGITAGIWGLALTGIGMYNVIKRSIVSHSETLQNFERNNPVTSFLLDVGAIFGGLALGGVGIAKFMKKHPEKVVNLNKKANKVLAKLDKTKLNKEILPSISKGVAKVAQKAPWAIKAGKFALVNSIWAILGVALLKMAKYAKDDRKEAEQNYQILKNKQLGTAKYLVNALGVERDILAQAQPGLAKDLRQVMNGNKPVSEKELIRIIEKAEAMENKKAQVKEKAETVEKVKPAKEKSEEEKQIDK